MSTLDIFKHFQDLIGIFYQELTIPVLSLSPNTLHILLGMRAENVIDEAATPFVFSSAHKAD